VLDELQVSHEVFAPTLPGHRGDTPLAHGAGCSSATLTDAIEAQLDANGISAPHVAGNSLGERSPRNPARLTVTRLHQQNNLHRTYP